MRSRACFKTVRFKSGRIRRRQRREKKYLESSELVVNVKKMVAFLFFFYILQIPTRGEHPADEHADDTTKGDASGEHGAEERALFALLRGVSFSFFFARAV